jgi:hypothetical protein
LGTSRAAEAEWRERNPRHTDELVDLGVVTEAEKAWLLANAALMIYPTVQEGFGLVPFEAGEAGLATLWAAHTALAEVLPTEAAGIVAWNVAATAERAAELLADESARTALVAAVRAAGSEFTWDRTAAAMVEVYRRAAAAAPRVPPSRVEDIDDQALALVGPNGWIPPDAQRALLAVLTRPSLRAPFLAGLRVAYRLLYRMRRAAGAA